MDSRPRTFADETSTGIRPDLRGPRRATIAARIDDDDFDWWLRFVREYLHPGIEPKSLYVLPIVQYDPRARDQLLDGVSGSAIAIVDFSDFTRSLLEEVRKVFDRTGPPVDVMEAFRTGRLPRDLTEKILQFAREDGVESSTIPRTEWLLREAARATGIISDDPRQIFNRDELLKMDAQQLRELIARFALALGDALHPQHQADIIERHLEDARFISEGHVAYLALEETMAPDRFYDQGSATVFAMLDAAHSRITDALERMRMFQLQQDIRAGALVQEDSRRVLGLQLADIAAAVARDAYENATGDCLSRARAVRSIFSRVLLNDKWLP